jgi:molecular chaperone DnaK
MQKILGIDLGTTNSVAAFMSKGAPMPVGFTASEQTFPSVVSIERNGKFEVGAKAKRSNRSKIYSAKRFIGRKFADPEVQHALRSMDLPYQVGEAIDGSVQLTVDGREFSPVEIGAMVLRKIKEAAEAQYGEFSRAIITVPAYFRESQVAATREAGRLAGFHVVKIINEPTAAALAFGNRNARTAQQKLILAYDFGGGTFDVSIMMPDQGSFTVLEIGGDAFLGGDNIDNKLMRRVRDEVKKEQGIDIFSGPGSNEARVILKQETERLKIGLSSNMEESIDLPLLNGANVYHTVRREELEMIIEPLVQQSIDITHETMARKGLTPADIDMVLLIGGTTQIPYIKQRLSEIFGAEKLQLDVNPMLSVAEGAAVISAIADTIDCLNCMESNDIAQEQCQKCGAALFGSGNPIGERMGERMTAPLPVAKVIEKATGLKCMECGHVCAPGDKTCPKCGFDLAVKETIDMTAHPIGIELQDGSFAPIITIGTYFPMKNPESGYFRTSTDNQQRLEVNVYEGADPIARNNELIGTIDIPLITKYAKGTSIAISLKLDQSRTTEVFVQINPPQGEETRNRIKRNQLTPELKENMVKTRQEIVNFLDRWKDETTLAEQVAIRERIKTIDNLLVGEQVSGMSREQLEKQTADASASLENLSHVRGTQATLSQTLARLEGIAPPDDLQRMRQIHQNLDAARNRADFEAAQRLADEGSAEYEKLGGLRSFIFAEFLGESDKLSPSLATRVQNATSTIRRGMQSNNMNQVDSGFSALENLWPEIHSELERQGQSAPSLVRPER